MSTPTTTAEATPAPKIPPFPYDSAGNAAEAVRRFFAERTQITDADMSNSGSTPELKDRVCELIASMVEDRLCTFYSGKRFSRNEEIEFVFKKHSEEGKLYKLVSPIPLVKDLEYRFRTNGGPVSIEDAAPNLARSGDTLVLRVSPRLVTFAGCVVWQWRK